MRKWPTLRRLYPSLMKRWTRLTWTGGFKVVRRDGLLWLLDHRYFVDRKLGLLGGWEKAQLTFLKSALRPRCDAFLDIGANFGLYSLHIAHARLADEIHAFEPDLRSQAQFAGNMLLNRSVNRVTLHRLALSDARGFTGFCPGER